MKLDVPQTEELTEVATPSMEHIDPPMKSTSCRPGRTTPTLQWQTASSHSLSAKLPWHKVRSAEPHVSPSARRCPLMRTPRFQSDPNPTAILRITCLAYEAPRRRQRERGTHKWPG
ncbi:hypothetical protein BHE74_00016706 [Ensete ventricosum]|nr:hypothetical protein BHE74_00016706 [Ensete ventricosum]